MTELFPKLNIPFKGFVHFLQTCRSKPNSGENQWRFCPLGSSTWSFLSTFESLCVPSSLLMSSYVVLFCCVFVSEFVLSLCVYILNSHWAQFVSLVRFKEHYSWNKATSCVHNILGGQQWVDHYGEVMVVNQTLNITCKLTYVKVCFSYLCVYARL